MPHSLGATADGVPSMIFIVAGEYLGERDVLRINSFRADISRDPTGKFTFGDWKILSAERCSASLSCMGVRETGVEFTGSEDGRAGVCLILPSTAFVAVRVRARSRR